MLSSQYRDVSSVVERGITNLEIVSSRPARRLFFTRLIHLILSASSIRNRFGIPCVSESTLPASSGLRLWQVNDFTTSDDNRSYNFTLWITLRRIIRYKDLDKPQSLWVAIIVQANTRNGLCNLK